MAGQMEVIELEANNEYQPLLKGVPQTRGMRSGKVLLKTGASIGEHSTVAHEELLTFLAGEGTAIIGENGDEFSVGKGKVAYIPPHTTHNIKNTGSEDLVYIYCVAPVPE